MIFSLIKFKKLETKETQTRVAGNQGLTERTFFIFKRMWLRKRKIVLGFPSNINHSIFHQLVLPECEWWLKIEWWKIDGLALNFLPETIRKMYLFSKNFQTLSPMLPYKMSHSTNRVFKSQHELYFLNTKIFTLFTRSYTENRLMLPTLAILGSFCFYVPKFPWYLYTCATPPWVFRACWTSIYWDVIWVAETE